MLCIVPFACVGPWIVNPVLVSTVQEAEAATQAIDDARLAGYLEARIEHELGWARDSYRLTVADGIAQVTVAQRDRERRTAQIERLQPIEGLAGLEVVVSEDPPESARESSSGSWLGLVGEATRYPVGDVFLPLLADPKTPQFFVSLRHQDTSVGDTTIGAVGFGETFGLWRRLGRHEGDGLQVSLAAGLFSQFDMETDSYNLVNSDFTAGLPITWRKGAHSVRLRLYHESSHLGDDFVIDTNTERRNLSFESLELLYSLEGSSWRAYGGGESLFRREPEDLSSWGAHAGLEWRGQSELWGLGSGIGGLDLKSWEENDGDVDASLVLGLEQGGARPGRRGTRWVLEFYDGYSPYGQFRDQKVRYVGFGIYLGF